MTHDVHLAIGHGGRNRMIKETQTKLKHITTESIILCLSFLPQKIESSKKKFGDQVNNI